MKVNPFEANSSPRCVSLALKLAEGYNLHAQGQFTEEALQTASYVDDRLMSVPTAKNVRAVVVFPKPLLLKGAFVRPTLVPVRGLSSLTVNLDRQQTEARKDPGIV
ncbi:hypothetical protein P879_10206 [Paragonimus westermani]|uniref:Uncharacterized protein n=1 Tax=Paragonimus westermani TaxID=34504 RepID=A0A8T0DJN9_9TREM|nr:hypothetical protein P879_10206 [Paragonimus westermani]